MKRVLFLVLLAALACDTKIVEETSPYMCLRFIVTDYCAVEGSIDEVIIEQDTLKYSWTLQEIQQYEAKGSFTIEEKCFYRVQITKCYPWHL